MKNLSLTEVQHLFSMDLYIRDKKEATNKIYTKILSEFLDYLDSKQNLSTVSEITTRHIKQYKIHLYNNKHSQELIDQMFSCLKIFFEILEDRCIITSNPINNLKHVRKKYVSDIKSIDFQLLDDIKDNLYYNASSNLTQDVLYTLLVIELCITRLGIQRLKWSDIDFEEETIVLNNLRSSKLAYWSLNKNLLSVLKKFKQESTTKKSTFVLENLDNSKMSDSTLKNRLNSYIKRFSRQPEFTSKVKYYKNNGINLSHQTLRDTEIMRLTEEYSPINLLEKLGYTDYKSITRYVGGK